MDATADWVRDLDVDALARWYGTPLHILSEARLAANLAALASVPEGPSGIVFPVKANPSPGVLRFLAERGCRADCASAHEVRLAREAGFPIERIVCNSPAPDPAWFVSMWMAGAVVVVDSPEVLRWIAEGSGAPHRPRPGKGKVFVRVNPQGEFRYGDPTAWSHLVAHASPQGKFGIPAEEIESVLQGFPLPVDGLHVHVGTQMDRTEVFVAARDLLHGIADRLREVFGHPVSTLDLGGGLGIPFAGSVRFPSNDEYAEALADGRRKDFNSWIAPGQGLVRDDPAMLTRVVATKSMRGRKWTFCDVGSDQLMKASLLGWHHNVRHRGARLPIEGPDAVGGPLCFAGDVVLPATCLDGVETGDLLLVESTGAYCFALANHFNGRLGPAHVAVAPDGTVRKTLAAEGFEGDHAARAGSV
ncbi:MAG: diaminopimelate decarboxylase family protein [Armatimonadota bacterium]